MDGSVRRPDSFEPNGFRWLRSGRVLCAVLLAGWTAAAGAAQLTLLADAHVNSAAPSVNSGAISNLDVGGGYTAFLQFDTSTLPAGVTAGQIAKATLTLYANRVATGGLVSLAPVSGGWGEYSVTYTSEPLVGAAAALFSVTQGGGYVTVDVTSLVQGWVTNPASNFGVALSAGTAAVQFDSKENDVTSHAAALSVELVDAGPAGPSGPPGAAGAPGPAGVAGQAGPMGPTGARGLTGPPGVSGPQGVPGVAGAAGAAGAVGPAGPMGPVGPTGATGATGASGAFVYQGSYGSAVNYTVGDVVAWQGASYVSLAGSNHGNTPGASPAWWGVVSAEGSAGPAGPMGPAGLQGAQGLPGSMGANGPPGPAGPQGIAGQAGAQGIPGAAGATGLQGPMGPAGPAGPVGMTFRGLYSATMNYGLGDGVSYQGAGYVSLVASNGGNTPDQSPAQWLLFAAAGAAGAPGPAGPAGASGPAGPQGAAGVAGTPGATGATGPQGPAVANYLGPYQSGVNYGLHDAVNWLGSTWVSLVGANRGNAPDQSPAWWGLLAAQGPAGVAGAAGPQGLQGPAGAAGATGANGAQGPPVTFDGGWVAGQTYGVGEAVGYGGASYIALAGNVGRQPDVSPSYWGLLAAAGTAGATGAAGPQGLQGPQGYAGPAGPAGPTGAQGPAGAAGATGAPVNFLGAYVSGQSYAVGDAVGWAGSSYISMVAGNRGNVPDQSPAAWGLLAAQGASGAAGAAGPTGATGPAGATGGVGPAGATGATGSPGMNFRGAWASGTGYGVSDAVSYGGSTYLAQAGNTNSEPDLYPQIWAVLAAAGGSGPTGPAGTAATVSVGTVTTGAPGSTASVTNVGTGTAAVLDFVVPQGAAGAAGSGGGGGGTSGVPFASMYHAVSYYSTYYSVNNPNAAAGEAAAVLTWVPAACTATELTVFSQQGNSVTVTLRAGLPGSVADTALACPVASGGSCTVTGSVAVAAGSFMDLRITGANGTAAGVWTAVACN